MEGANVVFRSKALLRPVAEFDELQLPQLVRQRLSRIRDVAVSFSL